MAFHRINAALLAGAIVFAAPAVGSEDRAREWIWARQNAVTAAHAFDVRLSAEGDDLVAADAIQVIDRRTGAVVQTIADIGGMGMRHRPTRMLSVTDVNADGHPDLVLACADGGAGPNNTDCFYLFNPKTSRFEFHEALSNLSQVTVHPHGVIKSASRGGCCHHSAEAHRFIRGRLIRVASWERVLSADGDWVETTVGRLHAGRWRTSTRRERQ